MHTQRFQRQWAKLTWHLQANRYTLTDNQGDEMTFSVTMPALGESVSEGTVTRWLKAEGDHVKVDEPLLEVSTDKVDTEIPSPVAGVLTKIVVQIDQTVAVGAELAVISEGVSGDVIKDALSAVPALVVPTVEVVETPVVPSVEVVETPTPVVAAPVAPTTPTAGTVITMPALGESVSEGTVTRWLKNVGDTVAVDEALLEVSTDKVDTEIPSPVAGVLLAIDVPIDTTVAVGARLALIGVTGAVTAPIVSAPVVAAPVVSEVVTKDAVSEVPAQVVTAAPVVAAPIAQPMDVYVTPLVRKLANDLGVNLANVKGTGVGGRIRREDIESLSKPVVPAVPPQMVSSPAATSSTPSTIAVSPLRGTTVTMTRLRKVIAARMLESLHVSAQLTTVVEVDVTKIARLRDRSKANFEAREGVKLSFLPFFAVAICEALKQHPVLNSSVEGDQITYHGAEHLGVAVDTERGLLVPVIANAGDLNMGGIARKIADLAARTREGKVTPDELGGGTFTLTNTGSRGALFDTPIINQPQVAILGLGAVVKRPMVVRGEDGGESIAIRSMVYLALSYDHRVVDGADAARFLVTLKERLEGGAFESDLGL
jgi:2-oxoglutarate dehydrogenase E2 component (dihydrolipoamide succinyltransferase)